MPDYNLFGLSSRSFEQLVQALSVKVIGPDVVVFGDGPDGAREATFSGKINYPNKRSPWEGDGTIQAKFLQRPHDKPKLNADWLLTQLASEMKKFAKRGNSSKKKRPSTDYYILATNVTLSAKAKTGGKDRLQYALERYKGELGWKGFDIWDADKISRYLDDNRDVATTYAAWITSGDVLESVIRFLDLKRPDFHKVMFSVLQKELLDSQYANLRQAGHTEQERVPLSRVFVDLPIATKQLLDPPDEPSNEEKATDSKEMDTLIATVLTAGSSRLNQAELQKSTGLWKLGTLKYAAPESFAPVFTKRSVSWKGSYVESQDFKISYDPDALKLSNIFENAVWVSGEYGIGKTALAGAFGPHLSPGLRAGRIVLLGGPGQGKTTLGQFACQLYRVALLKEAQRPLSREVADALNLIRVQCEGNIPIPRGRRYPIHIDLKALAAYLAKHDPENPPPLLQFLSERIGLRAAAKVSVDDMKVWLERYPWFMVFDGLDEVPVSGNRPAVMKCINDFMVDADGLDADLLVLATCRPQSYSKEFDERYYQHFWLTPLSERRALEYGNRLLAARHSPGSPERLTFENRLVEATKKPATVRLMRSPLQVTIMTALVERIGTPPEQRWSLFGEYYRVIYDRETERGTKWSDVLREYKSDIDLIHHQAGNILQSRAERVAQTEAKLTDEDYKGLVSEQLRREGHAGQDLNRLVGILSEAVKDRLVFLAPLTDGYVGFEIRSLQEFMAAESLFDAGHSQIESHEKVVKEKLRSIAISPYWRNVFLFAAGRIFAKDRHLREFLSGLCQEMNETGNDPAAAELLTGSQLALDLLEDGSARSQPNSTRAIARVASRVLDLPLPNLHSRLASQCGGSAEAVIREEIERRLASEAVTAWTSSWRLLSQIPTTSKVWPSELATKCWPKESATLLKLLEILLGELLRSKSNAQTGPIDRFLKHSHELSPVAYASMLRLRVEPKLGIVDRLLSPILGRQPILNVRLSRPSAKEPLFIFSKVPCLRPQVESAGLDTLGGWHPGWRIFLSALRFGLNPNSQTLSSELEQVARIWDPKIVDLFSHHFPWPFGDCLASCKTAEEVAEFAVLAKSGRFGDHPDWATAERRWSEDGIRIEDLLSMTDDRWPYDAKIGHEGFPFSFGSLGVSMSTDNLVQGSEVLLQAIPKAKTKNQSDMLLKMIESLQFIADEGRIPTNVARDVIKSISSLGLAIRPGCLISAFATGHVHEQAAFFNELGSSRFISDRMTPFLDTHMGEFCDVLARGYTRDTKLFGLLKILSAMPSGMRRVSIPIKLLDPDRFTDPEIKRAAFTVRLDQTDWQYEEVPELIAQITENMQTRPDLIDRICHTLRRSNRTALSLEHLLIDLISCRDILSEDARSSVLTTLALLVARRRSHTQAAAVKGPVG